MTLILSKPLCVRCKEPAMCLYSGVWICGRCLELVHKKEQNSKLKSLMEIREDVNFHSPSN